MFTCVIVISLSSSECFIKSYCTQVQLCTCMYASMYILCTCMYASMYILCTCMYASMYILCTCMYASMYILCTCMYASTYILCTCMYAYFIQCVVCNVVVHIFPTEYCSDLSWNDFGRRLRVLCCEFCWSQPKVRLVRGEWGGDIGGGRVVRWWRGERGYSGDWRVGMRQWVIESGKENNGNGR